MKKFKRKITKGYKNIVAFLIQIRFAAKFLITTSCKTHQEIKQGN